MGDSNPKTPHSPASDFGSIFGISKTKTIGKACKSLVMKLQPDKNHHSKNEDKSKHKKGTSKVHNNEDSVSNGSKHNGEDDLDNFQRRSVDDSFLVRPKLSPLSRNMSRRSKTPSPRPSSFSRTISRRSVTPTFLTRMTSRKTTSDASKEGSLSRSASRNQESSLSRNASKKFTSEAETPKLSRNMSVKGSTPIIFSQSSVRRIAVPIEKKLECTLEELCFGSTKTIKITRDAVKPIGIVEEEETLTIEVKPGWRKGTKIRFEGKGDEKPGYLPADIVFVIDEKRHSLFRRQGDDLEIGVDIPLVSALTGCTIPVPLLGGDNMKLTFENIVIYPGYEKVIKGEGMPDHRQQGRRGDLRIKFFVTFPKDLSDEQRKEAVCILQECC